MQAAIASVATQAGVPALQAQLGASYVNSQLLAVLPGFSTLEGQCIPCLPGCSTCAAGPLQCSSCLGGYTLVNASALGVAPPPAVPVPSPPPSISALLSALLGAPAAAPIPSKAATYAVCLPSAASGGLGAVMNNLACSLLQSANVSASVIARLPGCVPLLATKAAAAPVNNTGARLGLGNSTSPPPVIALSGPPAANSWLAALAAVQSAASPLAGALVALNAVDSQLQLVNMTVLDASLFAAANTSLSQLQALAGVVSSFLGNGTAPAAQQAAAALASHSVAVYVTCNPQRQANASVLQSAFWALLPEVNSAGTFSVGKALGTWSSASLTSMTCVLWRWNLTSDVADAVGQSVINRSAFTTSSSRYTANFTSVGGNHAVARATFSLHTSNFSAGNSSSSTLSAVLAAARAYRAMAAAQSAPPPPPSPPKPPLPPPHVAAMAGPPSAAGSSAGPAGLNATALINDVLALLSGLRLAAPPPPLPPPSTAQVSAAPASAPTAMAPAPSAAAAAPPPLAARAASPPPPPPPSPSPPPPSPSTTLSVQSLQSPPVPPPPPPLRSPPPPPPPPTRPPPPPPLSVSWLTSTATPPAPGAQQNASLPSPVAAPAKTSSRLITLIVVLVVLGGAACGIGTVMCIRRKRADARAAELPISVSRSSRTIERMASSPRGARLVAAADASESPHRKGKGMRSGG